MTQTDHLARAKDYIARGEDYYRKAAQEIVAAMEEDPRLSQRKIAARIGKSQRWVGDLVRWHTSEHGRARPTPYAGDTPANRASQVSAAKKVARENPQAIVEAIKAAPAKAQREIADTIVRSSGVDESLKRVVDPPTRTPQRAKSAEVKLGDAVFALWEVGEMLMDEAPVDAQRVRMSSLADKAIALSTGIAHLLDTGQFEDAFRELVEEVGADK